MASPPPIILCQNEYGQLVPVAGADIVPRTAVFGILLESQKVLLLNGPQSPLFSLPGGLIDHHQSFDQGLRQLFRGATGADTVSGPLIHVTRSYHKYGGGGIKRTNLFFQLHRDIKSRRHFIDFDAPLRPQWVPLRDLHRSQLENGYDAIRIAVSRPS